MRSTGVALRNRGAMRCARDPRSFRTHFSQLRFSGRAEGL